MNAKLAENSSSIKTTESQREYGNTGRGDVFFERRFLVDVLAKRRRYPSHVEAVFRELFPGVYRLVRAINRKDHGTLIRILQRAVSWLVIECVAPRLVRSVSIMTLHDAIYSPRDRIGEVRDAFLETFDDLGFHLALKVE